MRLNRFLAAAGLGSRRHCDELIAAGRVTINGKICTNFSAQPAARDHVKVDDKLVRVAPTLTIMLHKPRGFVSTRKDLHARNTVFDLLPQKFSQLFNVGRLDAQTEGLLLLTNDGELAQRLTHPRFKVDKEYEITLDRPWDPSLAPKLLRGIVLDGQRAKIARILSLSPTASSRYPAARNKSADSAHVPSRRIPRQTTSPHSNRKSSARRFAVRALAGINKTGAQGSGFNEEQRRCSRGR